MGCRVTKTQIFNSVYGLFSEDIDENVIESHISKLRKRLRHRLGYDPVDSQRYLGYRLVIPQAASDAKTAAAKSSLAQAEPALIPAGD
jgi:DNA-binding response OmpR family regulator